MLPPFPILYSGGAWSPLRLGSKLAAWWTADRSDLLSLSGSAVTSWADVTHGYPLVQGVSSARPQYSGTSFGGAPGITFDGGDDELTCTDAALLAALPTGSSPGEIAAIVSQDTLAADTGTRVIGGYGGAASGSRRSLARYSSLGVNRARVDAGDGSSAVISGNTSVDLSGRHYVRGIITAIDEMCNVDGVAGSATSVVPVTAALRVRVGAISNTVPGNYLQGVLRDVLLIAGNLTTEEAAALADWALPRRMI